MKSCKGYISLDLERSLYECRQKLHSLDSMKSRTTI